MATHLKDEEEPAYVAGIKECYYLENCHLSFRPGCQRLQKSGKCFDKGGKKALG